MAFVGYHLHWPPDALMDLAHDERRRWVAEVSKINQRMNDESAT